MMESGVLVLITVALLFLILGLLVLTLAKTGATIITLTIVIVEFIIALFLQNNFSIYIFFISVFSILPTIGILFNIVNEVYNKYSTIPKKEKAIEKAKEEGRVVTAYLIKERYN